MNRLSMEFSDLSLNNPGCFDEETWLIDPPTTGTNENVKTPTVNEEDENLDKWLEGAMKKVDFRTRSALSRRLEKKRQKREKRERINGNSENSLAKIEEAYSRDDEHRVHRQLSVDHCLSPSSSVLKNSDYDCASVTDSEEEDLYFDAEEGMNKPKDLYYTPKTTHIKPMSLRNIHSTSNTMPATAKQRHNAKMVTQIHHQQRFVDDLRKLSYNYDDPDGAHMNLSELERKAKEQEQELRMELMNRRDRLLVGNGNDSGPNSASSSASSSIANMLATSKSVDFRSNGGSGNGNNGGFSGSVSSSHSNDGGSMNELDRLFENRTPTLNSRLPLPRRPVVPGKTGIPLPTPKSTKTLTRRNESRCSERALSIEVDDECF